MSVITDEFSAAVEQAPLSQATVPLIGNVTAQPITKVGEVSAELKAQLTSPVRWTESMRYLIDQGVTKVVEIGPKSVLTGLMRRIDRQIERENRGDEAIG
jgi:[acyl-carrier-protein] S-malonyltransferase